MDTFFGILQGIKILVSKKEKAKAIVKCIEEREEIIKGIEFFFSDSARTFTYLKSTSCYSGDRTLFLHKEERLMIEKYMMSRVEDLKFEIKQLEEQL